MSVGHILINFVLPNYFIRKLRKRRTKKIYRQEIIIGYYNNYTLITFINHFLFWLVNNKERRITMFKSYKKYYKTQDMHGSHIRIMYKPIGYYLTELLSKTRITPNQVTFFQFIFFLLTGVFYYFGTYPYLIFGALSFQIAHILDNVDGMLARKKGISNNYGAWLDDPTTFFSTLILFF